jgi:hypothetical protein
MKKLSFDEMENVSRGKPCEGRSWWNIAIDAFGCMWEAAQLGIASEDMEYMCWFAALEAICPEE